MFAYSLAAALARTRQRPQEEQDEIRCLVGDVLAAARFAASPCCGFIVNAFDGNGPKAEGFGGEIGERDQGRTDRFEYVFIDLLGPTPIRPVLGQPDAYPQNALPVGRRAIQRQVAAAVNHTNQAERRQHNGVHAGRCRRGTGVVSVNCATPPPDDEDCGTQRTRSPKDARGECRDCPKTC